MKKIIYSAIILLASVSIFSSCQKSDDVKPLTMPGATADVSSHSMTVRWDAVPDAVSYVYRFNGGGTVLTPGTTAVFDGLNANTDYEFAVRAIGSSDEQRSEEQSFIFTTNPEVFSVSAQISNSSFDGISVNYSVAGSDLDYVRWALGSEFSYDSDLNAFKNGIDAGKLPLDKNDFTIAAGSYGLQAGQPAVIFIQAISVSGAKGPVIELKANAAPVSFSVSKMSTASFVATLNNLGEDYAGIEFIAADTEELALLAEGFGMTSAEILTLLFDLGMGTPIYDVGESELVWLSGIPDKEYWLGVAYLGTDFSLKDVKILNCKTPKIVSNAPKAGISVKVENITESAADLVFTPDDNTAGYCYKLYKKDDFELDWADGYLMGWEPLEYIRQLVFGFGSFGHTQLKDHREPLFGDYVLVCFPYNVNGPDGYGDSVVMEFSTKSVSESILPVSAENTNRVSIRQKKTLKEMMEIIKKGR